MKYGSVCSGIEAASVAWEALGWKAAWLSEIEPFPSAALANHYPSVANLGDMTKIAPYIRMGDVEAPDILVGGTPCQAFSVAGSRKGLDDARGQLTLEFVKLANAIDTRREEEHEQKCIIVWENVPGVLSSKDNAFGCFLAALAGEDDELQPPGKRWPNAGAVFGPKRAIAWRVLDAQYFGLAQRRRRVFVVASARAGFHPAQVLFEREGLRRVDQPGEGAGETDAAWCIKGAAIGRNPAAGPQYGEFLNGAAYTLNCVDLHGVISDSTVRRLTPRECERLQGFPDDWTLIPWRGKPAEDCPDGPRYKAIGNSKAVPVVRWIGQRIEKAINNPWSNDL